MYKGLPYLARWYTHDQAPSPQLPAQSSRGLAAAVHRARRARGGGPMIGRRKRRTAAPVGRLTATSTRCRRFRGWPGSGR